MGLTREAVQRLESEYWFEPFPEEFPGFKVCLRPNRVGNAPDVALTGDIKKFCSLVFTDFSGYEHNGEPVPNSLQARMELMGVLRVRRALLEKAVTINDELLMGEPAAASD